MHATIVAGCALLTACSTFGGATTSAAPMMRGDTPATVGGWRVVPLLTIGETVHGYTAPGVLDGIGAFEKDDDTVRLLVNHELKPGNGYPYELANGTRLRGARISYFDIDKRSLSVEDAGLAYHTAYDRDGAAVTDPEQLNRLDNGIDGFNRFCSAAMVRAGERGFTDDIFFAGEELGLTFHGHGGTAHALDVVRGELWAVPAMGRAAFENVAVLEPGTPEHIALLIGDDREAAPLYLYVGRKNSVGDGSFLDRNGLAVGTLYAWRASSREQTPETFHGAGSRRDGTFVEVPVRDEGRARQPGYDGAGYLDAATLRAAAVERGAFTFARPEDLHVNPSNGRQVAFSATGLGATFPADNWGTVYIVDVDFPGLADRPAGAAGAAPIGARLRIVHDADDLDDPDRGIRNPDNLVWAADGYVYVQEDRATEPGSLFGGSSGIESSIWRIDPRSGAFERIAEMNRSAVAPADAVDRDPSTRGAWESSGILDLTHLLDAHSGRTALVATVQAHSIAGDSIGGNLRLDEGGQLILLEQIEGR